MVLLEKIVSSIEEGIQWGLYIRWEADFDRSASQSICK